MATNFKKRLSIFVAKYLKTIYRTSRCTGNRLIIMAEYEIKDGVGIIPEGMISASSGDR